MLTEPVMFMVRLTGYAYFINAVGLPILLLHSLKKISERQQGLVLGHAFLWVTTGWVVFCTFWPEPSFELSRHLMFLPSLVMRSLGF